MLCFLSPILNSFIERYGKNIWRFVFLFIFIEFWVSCVRDDERLGFNHGYSVIHFILIYMLARLIYLNRDSILKLKYHIIGFFCCSILLMGMYYYGISWTYDYSNPIVIAESLFLFLPFLHYNFHVHWINVVAGSVLAVYAIHTTACGYLMAIDKWVFNNYSYGIYLMIIISLIVLIFAICVIYDRFRILLFSSMTDKIFRYLKNRFLKSDDYLY